MDNNADLLAKEAGCSFEEARIALNKFGGSFEEARDFLLKYGTKDILIIKGTFRGETTNTSGIFAVILRQSDRKLERFGVAVSLEARVASIPVTLGWRDFEEKLYSERMGKSLVKNLTFDLQAHFENRLNTEDSSLFIQLLLDSTPEELQSIFSQEAGRSMLDSKVNCSINIEKVSRIVFEGLIEDKEPKKEERPYLKTVFSEKALETLNVVKVSPILAPVTGLRVGDLVRGQMVYVKIIDDNVFAYNLAELLGVRTHANVLKDPLPIERIIPAELGKVIMLTKFSSNVYGETVLSPDVKIKTAETEKGLSSLEIMGKKELKTISAPVFLACGAVFYLFLRILGRFVRS